MLSRLPLELALEVFLEAMEIFVVSDRASAVLLAQTNRLVYATVRPILLRRVVATTTNLGAIGYLLQQADSAALILDLTAAAAGWSPSHLLFCNLPNLRCLRGIARIANVVISGLPASGRASLFKIHLWAGRLKSVLPFVTHVCLYTTAVGNLSLQEIFKAIKDTPSLTTFGCELVAGRDDRDRDLISPDKLVAGIRAILDAGGPRIFQIVVRLWGRIVVADDRWVGYLAALHRASEEEAWASEWGQRVHLWRNIRCFEHNGDEIGASISDAMAGVDVWSEARPLSSLFAEAFEKRL